jgi:hypothetical protein
LKILDQKTWRLKRTEEIICNLPANDRCLSHQESIREVNLTTRPSQSAAVSLLVIKGTPKYLTGRQPSAIFKVSNRRCFSLTGTPEQKKRAFSRISLQSG